MSFERLGPLWVGLGVIGLAAALFLLQRLRVRHRTVTVPTTLFWRQAVEETRARIFKRRFRHPWAYLLFLSLASLLWLALSGLRWNSSGSEKSILLVDGSAGMAWGERFEVVKKQLLSEIDSFPAVAREVWWSGEQPLCLLREDEPNRLLEERLRGLRPETTAAKVQEHLELLVRREHESVSDPEASTSVYVYGDAVLETQRLNLLPPHVRVERRPSAEKTGSNAGILNLGVHEAQSGAWDKVDILIETVGQGTLRTQVDGAARQLPIRRTPLGDERTAYRIRDFEARGQQIRFDFGEDEIFAADNQATLVLPNRPLLQVALTPEMNVQLRSLLEADPAVQILDSVAGAELVVRSKGDSFATELPALVFDLSRDSQHAFTIQSLDAPSAEHLLEEAYTALAMGEIDGLSLAQSLQQPVSMGAVLGGPPTITLWNDLLQPDAGWRHSRSFPLFIGRSLRWLAARDTTTPFAELTDIRALEDRSASGATSAGLAAVAGPRTDHSLFDFWQWLILIAVGLFLWEGYLHLRERVP